MIFFKYALMWLNLNLHEKFLSYKYKVLKIIVITNGIKQLYN